MFFCFLHIRKLFGITAIMLIKPVFPEFFRISVEEIKMEKPLYVTLDPGRTKADRLVKRLDEFYKEMTFEYVVEKMLDPEADELNEAYNPTEKEVAGRIAQFYDQRSNNPNAAQLSAFKNDESGQRLSLHLDDTVADHLEKILSLKTEQDDKGQVYTYQAIHLLINAGVSGGYR